MFQFIFSLFAAFFSGGVLGILFFGEAYPGCVYGPGIVLVAHFGIWLLKGAQKAVDELFDVG